MGRNSSTLLTGEAQKACRDLSATDAANYGTLKASILAHYGCSLPARAQQFHAWGYDPTQPVRPQVATLARLMRSWLTSGDGPPAVDRIIMDRCVRALPNDAKRYAAQTSPNSLEGLITLLENHQVTVELMKTTRQENPRASRPDHRPERDRPSKMEMPPRAKAGPVTPPRRHPAADRNLPMCYSVGSWATCPGVFLEGKNPCPQKLQKGSLAATAPPVGRTRPLLLPKSQSGWDNRTRRHYWTQGVW